MSLIENRPAAKSAYREMEDSGRPVATSRSRTPSTARPASSRSCSP